MTAKLEFKIGNLDNIIIKDTTEYPNPDINNPLSTVYSKLDSGSIIVLGYHRGDNKIEYPYKTFINQHTEQSEYKINVPKDGWITLYHIILPTKEHIDKIRPSSAGTITGSTYCFYIYNNKIYDRNHKDKEGNDSEIKVKTLLSINPMITNIYIASQDYISICNLQKCLVNLCLDIFKELGITGKCFSKKASDSDLIYKRDLVWMAINVIKYMTKYNMKAEAARIINQLEGCNGICTRTRERSKSDISGCGCNKQT